MMKRLLIALLIMSACIFSYAKDTTDNFAQQPFKYVYPSTEKKVSIDLGDYHAKVNVLPISTVGSLEVREYKDGSLSVYREGVLPFAFTLRIDYKKGWCKSYYFFFTNMDDLTKTLLYFEKNKNRMAFLMENIEDSPFTSTTRYVILNANIFEFGKSSVANACWDSGVISYLEACK